MAAEKVWTHKCGDKWAVPTSERGSMHDRPCYIMKCEDVPSDDELVLLARDYTIDSYQATAVAGIVRKVLNHLGLRKET